MKPPEESEFIKKEINLKKLDLINRTESVLVEHFENEKCKTLKCIKIGKIDKHFKGCYKISTCRWCKEFFALICYHTLYKCKNYSNCVVPYCESIRLKYVDCKVIN